LPALKGDFSEVKLPDERDFVRGIVEYNSGKRFLLGGNNFYLQIGDLWKSKRVQGFIKDRCPVPLYLVAHIPFYFIRI